MRNTYLKKTIILCCTAIFLFCQYPAVNLMAKNTSNAQGMAEAEDFIRELYEAESNRDVNWIREKLEDDAVEDWAIKLGKIYFDDFCFQRYDNIQVKAYPTSDKDYFAAYAAYDMVIEWNGETLALPGFIGLIIKKSGSSEWHITSGNDLSDALEEEIRQLSFSDEIVDMYNTISIEYNDMLAGTPELSYWINDMNDRIYHWVGSWLSSETCREKGAWDYLFGEEDGLLTASLNEEKNDIYIVQKGDCLWSIAERELGDGMYWVRLYEANRDVIGENPDLLWVGTELDLAFFSSAS